MRTRPLDLAESDLTDCLMDGWGLTVVRLEYVAVGGGSHHWLVHDAAGKRHWVTVDDVRNHAFLGDTPAEAFDGLRCALDTALVLRETGLEFVVAPQRSMRGATVEPLSGRYGLAVYPYVAGTPGQFGVPLSPDERSQVIEMLVRLHQATPAVTALARPWRVRVAARKALEDALNNLDSPWATGPFSEPARAALSSHIGSLRRLLATFDELAAEIAAACPSHVITHGEPHSANFIRADGRLFMVDWDTVALAPPERDLWMGTTVTADELARYTAMSGRNVNPTAQRLYRLRWLVDDISLAVAGFRSAHDHTVETRRAWQSLTRSLASARSWW